MAPVEPFLRKYLHRSWYGACVRNFTPCAAQKTFYFVSAKKHRDSQKLKNRHLCLIKYMFNFNVWKLKEAKHAQFRICLFLLASGRPVCIFRLHKACLRWDFRRRLGSELAWLRIPTGGGNWSDFKTFVNINDRASKNSAPVIRVPIS